jgi:hypothetical protein
MRTYWFLLAVVGTLAFSILFLADRERKAGVDRLSKYKVSPRTDLKADRDLLEQGERSPYMHDERD